MAFGDCWQSLAFTGVLLHYFYLCLLHIASSSPVYVSTACLITNLSVNSEPTQIIHTDLKFLILIAYAKIIFPNNVIFTGSRDLMWAYILGEGLLYNHDTW